MSAWDWITVVLVLGTPVVWIGWDVVVGAKRQTTESQFLAGWARRWSILPFAVGTIVGHWFVQNAKPNYALWPAGLAVLGVVLALDMLWRAERRPVPLRYPGTWLLLGIAAGHFLWPQRWPVAP